MSKSGKGKDNNHRIEFELEVLESERLWYPDDTEWQRKIDALVASYEKRLK